MSEQGFSIMAAPGPIWNVENWILLQRENMYESRKSQACLGKSLHEASPLPSDVSRLEITLSAFELKNMLIGSGKVGCRSFYKFWSWVIMSISGHFKSYGFWVRINFVSPVGQFKIRVRFGLQLVRFWMQLIWIYYILMNSVLELRTEHFLAIPGSLGLTLVKVFCYWPVMFGSCRFNSDWSPWCQV